MRNFNKQFSIGICLFLFLFICSFVPPLETIHITWKDLQDVKFKQKFNETVGMYFLYPEFGSKVKALEGKEIDIKGFIIPVDPAEKIFVLSARPMASCFFCGGSGPESIIQLKLKASKKFVTDDIWIVRGTLKLNVDKIEELNYILVDTEPIRKL